MKNSLSIALCCLLIFVSTATAANGDQARQWDRSAAMAAVQSVDIDRAINQAGNTLSLTDARSTLDMLRQMETRSDWPQPAREAALYRFTQSLTALPRSAVAEEVMQYLQNYDVQTLVPQEDHGYSLVPLFNIRAAAAGVENGWQRTEFAIQADEMLRKNPTALVSAYVDSNSHTQRSGYLDALRHADRTEVALVQRAALAQFDQASKLTRLVGETAAITNDTYAIEQLLIHGRGAGLSSALRQLETQLDTAEAIELLVFAIQQAPSANASLAIAAWWPGLRHEAVIRDLLVEKLADPNLGAAASLALAQQPDVQTIKLLQDTAEGNSVAARRAQMALDINRDLLNGEAR